MSFLSRRRDSNTRPLRPERSALPTAPLLEISGFGNFEESLESTLFY